MTVRWFLVLIVLLGLTSCAGPSPAPTATRPVATTMAATPTAIPPTATVVAPTARAQVSNQATTLPPPTATQAPPSPTPAAVKAATLADPLIGTWIQDSEPRASMEFSADGLIILRLVPAITVGGTPVPNPTPILVSGAWHRRDAADVDFALAGKSGTWQASIQGDHLTLSSGGESQAYTRASAADQVQVPEPTVAAPTRIPTAHPAGQNIITAGAFCSPEGATGVTSTGKPMVCTRLPGEDRARWRSR